MTSPLRRRLKLSWDLSPRPDLLTPGQPSPGFTYPPASNRRLPPHRYGSPSPKGGQPLSNQELEWTRTWCYRNINRLCIDYAFRPRLSSRLTLGGRAFPRNPWAFGGGDSHPSLATHASILTRVRSTEVHTPTSTQTRRSATPRLLEGAASAVCLAPLHFPRRITRPVSYYALFKGWLLLSQPPGCLCTPTSFPT